MWLPSVDLTSMDMIDVVPPEVLAVAGLVSFLAFLFVAHYGHDRSFASATNRAVSLATPLFQSELRPCECYARPVKSSETTNKFSMESHAWESEVPNRIRASSTAENEAINQTGMQAQRHAQDGLFIPATLDSTHSDSIHDLLHVAGSELIVDGFKAEEQEEGEGFVEEGNDDDSLPLVMAVPVDMTKKKGSSGGAALAEKSKTTGALDLERKKLEKLFRLDCGDGGGDNDDCDYDDGNGGNDGSGAFVWVTQHTYVQLIIAYYVLSDRVKGVNAAEFKTRCDQAFANSKYHRKDSVFAVWVPGKKHQKLIDALEGPSRPALAIHLSANDIPRAKVTSLVWDPRTLTHPRPKLGALTRELNNWLQGEGLRSIKDILKQQANVTESTPVLPNQTIIRSQSPPPPSNELEEAVQGNDDADADEDASSTAANAE